MALLHRLQPVDSSVIDPDVLKKVLQTLVKNAIENTPDGGTVTVILEETPSGPRLGVRIGGGHPPAGSGFIFEAFHPPRNGALLHKETIWFKAGGKGLELMQLKCLLRRVH